MTSTTHNGLIVGMVLAIFLQFPAAAHAGLGSSDDSLVYTPVAPCRIFDTREAGGIMAAGTTRNFFVHGDGAAIGGQGGNPDGCIAPEGEPVAVHLNLTVVPSATGHITVFPVEDSKPLASNLNFRAGANTANAITVKTLNAIDDSDISIFASGSTEVLADVQGYYYRADTRDLRNGIQYGTEPELLILSTAGIPREVVKLSVSISHPGHVIVNASSQVTAAANVYINCSLAMDDPDEFTVLARVGSESSGSDQLILFTGIAATRAFPVEAGTSTFYYKCAASGPLAGSVDDSIMTVIYSPNRLNIIR